MNVQGISLCIASAEDVVIAKLEWAKLASSPRQMEDVAGILKLHQGSLDHSYLENWIHELGLANEWSTARGIAGL